MKKTSIAILFAMLLVAPAAADILSPALIVKSAKKGEYEPLKISAMKVETRIVSGMAVTTMDMTFQNGLDRILEGQLVFPLPAGATVVRFAMDVQGKLREGVVVEKDKGRQVFEETVRRNIDPGLLEWVSGSNFKARVYPIPPLGAKRIVIAYEEELPSGPQGMVYRLPLQYKQPIGSFSMDLVVAGKTPAPEVSMSPFKDLGFKVEEGNHIARTHFDDMSLEGELVLGVRSAQSDCEVYVDGDGKEAYFYLIHRPEIASRPRELPKSVAVIWDASGSAKSRDVNLETALIDSYLGPIPGLRVRLAVFRDSAEPVEVFEGDGAVKKLVERIRSLHADGGTNLGCLDLSALNSEVDEYLLFTDGNSNFGGLEIRNAGRPVRAFSTSASANHPYLGQLAERTAGEYFNMASVSRDEALARLRTDAFRFLGADFEEGAVSDLHPRLPARVAGRFLMSGRLNRLDAEITINYGLGASVSASRKIKLSDFSVKDPSGIVRRIWAKREIAFLSVFPDENAAAVLALGRKFGIVTPATSLIILDSLDDYVKHSIIPPEDMQEAFWKAVESRKAEESKTREQRISEVLARWASLKQWWGTEFKYPDGLRVADKEKKEAEGAEGESEEGAPERRAGGAPAPSPTPAPGSAREERSRGDSPAKKDGGDDSAAPEGGITLKKWDPSTPYIEEIRKAGKDAAYDSYMKQRPSYAQSSAFFLDVADFFIDSGRKDLGLRILSNIAEMELDNHQLLRILGHRLEQIGEFRLAAFVFRKVLRMRPEEPQSYRDLGLVLAKMGEAKEAVAMLYRVVTGVWDDRFPEIDLIALVEMNGVIAQSVAKGVQDFEVDKRFLAALDVDLRIILDWDADNCDMDLWIVEPSGEKCFYSNRNTTIGGRMSCDFTRGYGPEEYMVRKAMPGKYLIQVNYYGNTQQVLAGATTIQILIVKNFGKPNEERISITRRLKDQKEVLDIGDVVFGKK